MTDTRMLLENIRELRQRLAQFQGLAGQASKVVAALLATEPGNDEGNRRQGLLDSSIRQLSEEAANDIRPTRLIANVRLQLARGRELVGWLKNLAEEPLVCKGDPILGPDADDPVDRKSVV